MKNLKFFTLLAFLIILGLQPSQAAFPVNSTTESVEVVGTQQQSNEVLLKSNAQFEAPEAPTPAPAGAMSTSTVFNIVAFVLGVVAVIAYSSFAAFILGGAAIVFAILGMKGGSLRGLGIAGLILGIVAAVVALAHIAS
jgi:hypothetical protein